MAIKVLLYFFPHPNCSCISLLLRWGANPSLSDVDGQTALFFALCEGYRECVDVLLDAPGNSLLTITKVEGREEVCPSVCATA